jgi:hypothetical protein
MTVLSLQWLLARARRPATMARSRWPAIVTRHLAPARRPVPPGRRAYPDLFFADPAAVEDDSRRMRHGTIARHRNRPGQLASGGCRTSRRRRRRGG